MDDLTSRADALLREAVDGGALPGVVLLASRAGEPLYAGAFGQRALGGDAPMTLDSVFWIASMTKPLVSAAALQLVEQGRLGLDEPVARRLPEIAAIGVLDTDGAGGEAPLRPPRTPITLRQLLNHTSGFGYEYWSAALLAYRKAHGMPAVGSGQRRAMDTPLLFDPGTRWEYGIGIDWAGLLIECVTGQALGEVLRQNLLEPLGMVDTAFELTPALRARLAKVHQRAADGTLLATDIGVPPGAPVLGGSGLHGSARDYLRFLQMILGGGVLDGRRVLQAASVAQMIRPQIGELAVRPLASVAPRLTGGLDFYPGRRKSFGFGFLVLGEDVPGGLAAGSLTWSGIANTCFWIDPSRDLAAVFLTQVLPCADERTTAVQTAVQGLLAGAAPFSRRAIASGAADR